MTIDTSRIEPVIDVEATSRKTVAIVGVGGSKTLICDLARCGVQHYLLNDFDIIEPSNVARQDHMADQIGMSKVRAIALELHRINPDVNVRTLNADFCSLSDEQIDEHFASVDLLIMATDSFAAQARGNVVALHRGIPAIWIGLYADGSAGEVAFWYPELDACWRCLCAERYKAHVTGIFRAIPSLARASWIFGSLTQLRA